MRFFIIWISAILCTMIAVGFLISGSKTLRVADEQVVEGDMIFIGSSLTRVAIPPHGSQACKDSGGPRVSRYAISAISEKEALDLLERAIQSRPWRIFLEINPFVIRFKSQQDNAGYFVNDYRDVRSKLSRAANEMIGVEQASLLDDTWPRMQEFDMSQQDLARIYPYGLKDPEHLRRLQSLVKDAKINEVEIILISYPRAQSVADFLGSLLVNSTEEHIEDVAGRLGLPIFVPATSWPNSYFYDNAHFNLKGRRLYLKEFASQFGTCL